MLDVEAPCVGGGEGVVEPAGGFTAVDVDAPGSVVEDALGGIVAVGGDADDMPRQELPEHVKEPPGPPKTGNSCVSTLEPVASKHGHQKSYLRLP